MRSEKEKMLAGELYNAADPELSAARLRARELVRQLGATPPDDLAQRQALTSDLVGATTDAWIEPPFACDYGTNIHFGQRVFLNFNCVILDVAPVCIGDFTLFGPGVQLLTATHPLDAAERRSGLEYAKPITIGADVWIGGGVIVCPGVSIGDRSVIGAGSIVTKDIPSDVIAAGNPARVLRPITAADRHPQR